MSGDIFINRSRERICVSYYLTPSYYESVGTTEFYIGEHISNDFDVNGGQALKTPMISKRIASCA